MRNLKTKITISVLAALAATGAQANNAAWDKFIDDSTLDMKLRTSAVKMTPSVKGLNNQLSPELATGLLLAIDPQIANQEFGTIDPQALVQILSEIPEALANVNAAINAAAAADVQKGGNIDQGGSSLWLEYESGYLFDMIGFDLGYQGGIKSYNDGTGTLILDSQTDKLSRLSTARVKVKIGSEEKNFAIKAGRGRVERLHYGTDNEEYLLDKTYEATEISANWGIHSIYGISATGIGDVISSEIHKIDDYAHLKAAGVDRINTLGYDLNSDYGSINLAHSFADDYLSTTSFAGNTGVPLAWLGAPISDENEYNYLLLAQLNYNMQVAGDKFINEYGVALPNHKADQYEIMIGAQLGNLLLATSFNQVGDKSFYDIAPEIGGGVTNLPGWALINDWNLAEQETLSFIALYNAETFGLPELDISFIYFDSSNINKNRTLSEGNVGYYLTGEEEFTEYFVDVRYTIQEGLFDGLMLRGVVGAETNQAKVDGYAVWIEYNRSIF